MFFIPYEMARTLSDEMLVQAEEARTVAAAVRLRRERRRAKAVDSAPDADIIELAFGTQCETDRIGA